MRNHDGLYALLVTAAGFIMLAVALPNNPAVMLAYLVIIPFLMMGIFVILVEIRNSLQKQEKYWDLLIDATKKKDKQVRK